MSPNEPILSQPVALLSAASATETLNSEATERAASALAMVGGEPLLAYQMLALRKAGVHRFLIEVDSIPGLLLAIADRFRKSGCEVHFVRQPQDLIEAVDGDRLIIQSETAYFSPELIASLLAENQPFIVTVDGREENARFERMDINTRWAGLALIAGSAAASLADLPAGWSMTSSLLRQAMQDGVRFKPLPQSDIQQGNLSVIGNDGDIEQLSQQILADRRSRLGGFIETHIFAPVSARLAAYVWSSPTGPALVDASAVVAGVTSLVLAGFGWSMAAITAALGAIFINSVRRLTQNPALRAGLAKWIETAVWVLLAMATIMSVSGGSVGGAFNGVMVVGLAMLSQHLALPRWGEDILKSPALLVLVALVATPILELANALLWIALAQLGLLIIATWKRQSA